MTTTKNLAMGLAAAVVATLAIGGATAEAKWPLFGRKATVVSSGGYAPVGETIVGAAPASGNVTITSTMIVGQGGVVVPPYSYYAAPFPFPARTYQGYGEDQFPYYGRPYGHANDPWTWPYISGGYQRQLSNYYHPPL